MPAGRPTEYDPSKNEEIVKLMAEGASLVEVAGLLDISRSTLYDWIDEKSPRFNKEFSDTLSRGMTLCQIWWEKNGRKNLDNPKFNHPLYAFNMTNRFRKDWKNKQSIEHSTEDDKPLKFGQIILSRPDEKTD